MTDPHGWNPPGSESQQGSRGQPPPRGRPPHGGPPPGHGPSSGGYGPPPGPKPGVIPLRPIGVGEILDGAVTYIRRNPKTTLGLSAIVIAASQLISLPATLAQLPTAVSTTSPTFPGTGPTPALPSTADIGAVLGSSLVAGLATLVLAGMLTSVVGRAVLGQRMTMSEAWRGTRPRIWALLGAAVLIMLMIALAWVVLVGPGLLVTVLASPGGGAALAVLGGLAWIAVAAWIYVTFQLAIPAIVLEGLGVRAGLRRSRALVQGSWWRVFGILLLAYLIAVAIQFVLFLPFFFATLAILGSAAASGTITPAVVTATVIITTLGEIVAATVARPFAAGVPALLYVDRRMRREGLDMQLRDAAGVAGPPYPGPAGPSGSVPSGSVPPGSPPPR